MGIFEVLARYNLNTQAKNIATLAVIKACALRLTTYDEVHSSGILLLFLGAT
jgi:hypothetical protein